MCCLYRNNLVQDNVHGVLRRTRRPGYTAVTTWGLMIMTLLLIIGAKIYFSRRRAAQA